MAGRGGLNLTHSEALVDFKKKYNTKSQEFIGSLLDRFTPDDLRNWCHELGEETFIGSSGRIFPKTFKASPLLRAWLKKLETLNVQFKLQRNWRGWDEEGRLIFTDQNGIDEFISSDYTLLSLGGASWPNLGSDGSWVKLLQEKNIPVSPLHPANCGFTVNWSDIFKKKFSGQPLKSIGLSFGEHNIKGEVMISSNGIEGGAVYALSSHLRHSLEAGISTVLRIDLKPAMREQDIIDRLQKSPRRKQSFTTYLQKSLGLNSLAINLLREANPKVSELTDRKLAQTIKSIPVKLMATFPIERAISSAGGVQLDNIDQNMMIKDLASVFVAGEMLDWEAPTGGYLLQACFATGIAAAKGIINYAKSD